MDSLMTDPIFLRGIERWMAVVFSLVFVLSGYLLFKLGITKGLTSIRTRSLFLKVTFSGTGPGLGFMAFGGLILIFALLTGRSEVGRSQSQPVVPVMQQKQLESTVAS